LRITCGPKLRNGVGPLLVIAGAGSGPAWAGADLVFREKVSGVRADRPQLAKLMAGLKPGDIVVVTKLDRLGRSTRELLDLIERPDPMIEVAQLIWGRDSNGRLEEGPLGPWPYR
jgi:Resolvase, N terminal domain